MIMSRLSRAYFPNREHSSPELLYYAFMFVRDIHTGIMPYRTGGKYPYTTRLSRNNQTLSRELAKFLSIGHHDGILLDETLREAIETLSRYIVTFGEVYLEIVYEDVKNKTGIKNKKLEFLPWSKVIRVFGRYIQIVPLRNWKRGEKIFYIIPSDRIWHIKLPRKLGTPHEHRKMLKKLNALSESTPKFVHENGDLGHSAKYDFIAHQHAKKIAVEQATYRWGSIPSLGRIDGTTEYYYIINTLRIAYSQVLLREHIINEINGLLGKLGIKNSLKIEGLKLATDIKDTIKKLEKDEMGFDEAVSAIKH